ncbi:MAG: hypothetical protein L3J08_08880 [Flavobacteriaceae bacterium]|nr:hypothetical protein [Flavobacteriaceae bacterium]
MPKKETKEIQQYLTKLGEKLGFISIPEQPNTNTNNYRPIYDVAWFIKDDFYNLQPLDMLFGQNSKWHTLTKQIPIATFEIEGSTTSSKNQLGNLLNLTLINSFLNFVVVNNEYASNENDTYRRGVKICRTFMKFSGKQNIIFLDWQHLKNIDKTINFSKNNTFSKTNTPTNTIRSKVGGEKDSAVMESLLKLLENTKINMYQNYIPPILKWQYSKIKMYQSIEAETKYDFLLNKKFIYDPVNKVERKISKKADMYYEPRIDFALVLQIPLAFKMFLMKIGENLKEEKVYYPILLYLNQSKSNDIEFPLLGVEVESSVNKHLNGGIFNMSKFFYLGLLVSPKQGANNLLTLEKLGLNNIFHINEEKIKEVNI